MSLPARIFFTGVPGSRWSSIAQIIESMPEFNTSDRTPAREYSHSAYSGHKGVYFGRGMEFQATPLGNYLDSAWSEPSGTRLLKSHEWPEKFDMIVANFPGDWIMLVYRPDMASYAWWHEAGGFKITYPNYGQYKSSEEVLGTIAAQNKAILEFAYKHDANWHHFSANWIFETFGYGGAKIPKPFTDVLVTIIKP